MFLIEAFLLNQNGVYTLWFSNFAIDHFWLASITQICILIGTVLMYLLQNYVTVSGSVDRPTPLSTGAMQSIECQEDYQ